MKLRSSAAFLAERYARAVELSIFVSQLQLNFEQVFQA